MKAKRVIKRILIIIGCVLLLLGGGYVYILHELSKAFGEIGEILANDFGVCHRCSLERNFWQNKEQYNKIDSVAREMIRSNPKGVLDDSAKQVLEPLFVELYPYRTSPIYFFPRFIQVSMVEPSYQPDSTKTCSLGYVWISAQLCDSGDCWAKFNKAYRYYQVNLLKEISISRLSKSRGWHIYEEGCD